MDIEPDDFVVRERNNQLGNGAYGNVTKFHWKTHDRAVAVKEFDEKTIRRKIIREFNILNRIDHGNVIRVFGVIGGPKAKIIMELADNGSLQKMIENGGYNFENSVSWMLQCAYALEYLHKNRIIHRDLKPANLLLHNNYHILKVCDFGFSDVDNAPESYLKGTPYYVAPERASGSEDKTGKYVHRSDIYSWSIIFYHLLYGDTPFVGQSQNSLLPGLLFQIAEGQILPEFDEENLNFSVSPKFVKTIQDIIKFSWNFDYRQRPDAEQLVDLLERLAFEIPNHPIDYQYPVGSFAVRVIGQNDRKYGYKVKADFERKTLNIFKQIRLGESLKEIECWTRLSVSGKIPIHNWSHSHILGCDCIDFRQMKLKFECFGHYNLFEIINRDSPVVFDYKLPTVLHWMHQCTKALVYLHSIDPIFKTYDLDPLTIFVDSDGFRLKLADFVLRSLAENFENFFFSKISKNSFLSVASVFNFCLHHHPHPLPFVNENEDPFKFPENMEIFQKISLEIKLECEKIMSQCLNYETNGMTMAKISRRFKKISSKHFSEMIVEKISSEDPRYIWERLNMFNL